MWVSLFKFAFRKKFHPPPKKKFPPLMLNFRMLAYKSGMFPSSSNMNMGWCDCLHQVKSQATVLRSELSCPVFGRWTKHRSACDGEVPTAHWQHSPGSRQPTSAKAVCQSRLLLAWQPGCLVPWHTGSFPSHRRFGFPTPVPRCTYGHINCHITALL